MKFEASVFGVPSRSVTPDAVIVTVQVTSASKLVAGSSVYVVPDPLNANVCVVESQLSANAAALVVTGSLKTTVTFVLAGTFVAAFAGMIDATVGATSTGSAST